ncbi:MAG TPA: phosphoribosylanthranilate isomerase [Fontimonas sp.]
MSRTRIKFCGIRRPADAQAAVALGVDAIGFVLVPQSKRHVALSRAASIRTALPPFVAAVALLMNPSEREVHAAIEAIRPDLLQFHGAETPGFCASFGLPYLKAVAMKGAVNLPREARRYKSASGLLLDGNAPGAMGGQGETFDWTQARGVKSPLIVAGGLTPANVARAVRLVRPYAVDVSSGIESAPGIKDAAKMRAFVAAVRRADARGS